ncbi:MAG: hypothetical protein WC222_01910 [Parachlamydiales bacterium]|jgi:hypothetical protein
MQIKSFRDLLYYCTEVIISPHFQINISEEEKVTLTALEAIRQCEPRPLTLIRGIKILKYAPSLAIFTLGALPFSFTGVIYYSGKLIYLQTRNLFGRISEEESTKINNLQIFRINEGIFFIFSTCAFITKDFLKVFSIEYLFYKHAITIFSYMFGSYSPTLSSYGLNHSPDEKIQLLKREIGLDSCLSEAESSKLLKLIEGVWTINDEVNIKLRLPKTIHATKYSACTALTTELTKIKTDSPLSLLDEVFKFSGRIHHEAFDKTTQKVLLRWKLLYMIYRQNPRYKLFKASNSAEDIFNKHLFLLNRPHHSFNIKSTL